jgi:RNA polymerase sigma-70 factor, ECF subfamily
MLDEDAERTIASRMEGSPQPAQERPGYRPGSVEDFDRLYEATNHRLFATLVTLLRDRAAAEDCLQEAYLRAFRAWRHWRAHAPAEAWLHRIAINVAVSCRRRERLREVGELIRRLGLPADPDPTELVVPELVRELRALPSKQAAALVLRHLHGYSNREIAHALGVPERTIASRLGAARNRLQARLGDPREGDSGTLRQRRVSSDK